MLSNESENESDSPSPEPINKVGINNINDFKPRKKAAKLSCYHCGRIFKCNYLLNLHVKRHEQTGKHKCLYCPKNFPTLGDLKAHEPLHTHEKSFKCRVCDKHFNKQSNRRVHEDTHGLNTYYCRYCGEMFKKRNDKIKHQYKHKLDKLEKLKTKQGKIETDKFECSFCATCFLTLEFQKKHEDEYHIKKKKEIATGKKSNPCIFSCTICRKRFKRSKLFRAHIISDHPDKFDEIFFTTCPICEKSISKGFLRYHVMAHKGIGLHKCPYCGNGFPRTTELNKHKVYCGRKQNMSLKCKYCPRTFKSFPAVRSHQMIHNGESNYLKENGIPCTYAGCSKTYMSKNSLTNHVKKQHERYLVKCEECNKQVYNTVLSRHMTIEHTVDEKLCDHCGISFQNETKLNKHLALVNIKNDDNSKLKTISLPVVKESCPFYYCKTTGSSHFIKKHMIKHHPEEMMACILCSNLEPSKFLLDKHMLDHGLRSSVDLKSFHVLTNSVIEEKIPIGECNICGYKSLNRISLKSHSSNHYLHTKCLRREEAKEISDKSENKSDENVSDLKKIKVQTFPIKEISLKTFDFKLTKKDGEIEKNKIWINRQIVVEEKKNEQLPPTIKKEFYYNWNNSDHMYSWNRDKCNKRALANISTPMGEDNFVSLPNVPGLPISLDDIKQEYVEPEISTHDSNPKLQHQNKLKIDKNPTVSLTQKKFLSAEDLEKMGLDDLNVGSLINLLKRNSIGLHL